MSNESLNDELNPSDRLSTALQAALREPTPGDPLPSTELRSALAARLTELPSHPHSSAEVMPMSIQETKTGWGRVAATLVASGVAAGIAISLFMPATQSGRESARREKYEDQLALVTQDAEKLGNLQSSQAAQGWNGGGKQAGSQGQPASGPATPNQATNYIAVPSGVTSGLSPQQSADAGKQVAEAVQLAAKENDDRFKRLNTITDGLNTAASKLAPPKEGSTQIVENPDKSVSRYSATLSAPAGGGAAISGPAPADPYDAMAPSPTGAPGYRRKLNEPNPQNSPDYTIAKPIATPAPSGPQPKFAIEDSTKSAPTGATPMPTLKNPEPQNNLAYRYPVDRKFQSGKPESESVDRLSERSWQEAPAGGEQGEQYEQRVENIFQGVRAEPLSTFSIDVDTASYTNCRRFLDGRQLPPTAAVRVEEFINYFRYDYTQPTGKDPFSVNMEMAECPWTPGHKLLRVGLKGKEIDRRERPQSNLVFLVDVSGSMSSEDKLPLLRDALHRWVNELSANDRVTICTYAGDAGLRLPTTRGDQKDKLHAAIETLQSGGSTHGSAGIKLAYEQATANFLEEGGVNRVLWATDGDLNVGTTGDEELVELITNKAKTGVFLTVLGVGTGNLKDAKLEKMADKGNGVYAYLDSPKEARKVLIEQMSGTTITIAKDVKIQIEFNPAEIAGYRLIGYENRILAAEDFANDKKDAGEIGAGHTVTALYELIPVDAIRAPEYKGVEKLKYQDAQTSTRPEAVPAQKLNAASISGELLTLKLRFKQPDGHQSELREFPLKERGGKFTAASKDFQFAGCVAQLAMILRDSQYRGTMTTAAIAEIAAATKGEDKDGSRAEFVELVKRVQELGK